MHFWDSPLPAAQKHKRLGQFLKQFLFKIRWLSYIYNTNHNINVNNDLRPIRCNFSPWRKTFRLKKLLPDFSSAARSVSKPHADT
jgi:hypothetical protein